MSQALRLLLVESSRQGLPSPAAMQGPSWLARLTGGLPVKANRPSFVNHWLMIHAVAGGFGLVVTRGVR